MTTTPEPEATQDEFVNLRDGMRDIHATAVLLSRVADTFENNTSRAIQQIVNRLYELQAEAVNRIETIENHWKADLRDYRNAIEEARATRAVPGSADDLRTANALWSMIRSAATMVLLQCERAEAETSGGAS